MSFHNVNFSAEVGPIYDRNGQIVPAEIARGVYRSDTNELISTCGKTYAPVQHMDLLDPVLTLLKGDGYEIVERKGDRRDLEDLRGQKGAFVSTSVAHNGAVMRADIVTGDFVQPTGSTSYLDKGPDTMLRRWTVLNSHNSSLAGQMKNSYMRLICMNGLVDPTFSVDYKSKHTKGFSIEAFRMKIELGARLMTQDADRFGLYARTRLTVDQAKTFLKKTFAKLPDKPGGEANWSEQLVDRIVTLFHKEDRTVWGLVQALTTWATHGELKTGAVALTARLGRDERVAQAMRSKDFQALLAK